MTIYDVPVDDTVFFPVSGDMMRLMKFEEEQRMKNDPSGTLAKESTAEAVDPNHYQEEQTMQNDNSIISEAPDTAWHPIWCTGEDCELTSGEYAHSSPIMTTKREDDPSRDGLPGWEAKGDITLLQFLDAKMSPCANVSINSLDFIPFDRAGLTQLIGFLEALRERLATAGED